MIRVLLAALAVPVVLPAQDKSTQEDAKAYARSMKEIVYQNDSQWEDNRWEKTDIGPFLAGTIGTPGGVTLKGLVIRVGDDQQATVCFDTARLRMSAAWTGPFLSFGPRRFGLIQPPRAAGTPFMTTPRQAGWALDGRFKPNPDEITLPDVEKSYTRPGSSTTCLPHEWAQFRGHYTSGRRVVLSYTVGETTVLESPWFVESDTQQALVRFLEIAPSDKPTQMWAAAAGMHVDVSGSDHARMDGSQPVLHVAPHDSTLRLRLLISKRPLPDPVLATLSEAAGDPLDLTQLAANDTGRYPQVLSTKGETSAADSAYVVDTLTLPFENPWNALFFTAGHDFFSDGTAAICTAHGDVWTVRGVDKTLQNLEWRRFATGLCQPLGLRIVNDRIHVIGRNQITRLHDRNNDGEADFYENFNNGMIVSPHAHDYVTCLDTDPDGNFYFIHARTGVMKVSADGSTITSLADGFRNPNGMGVSPEGVVTAAPQQGQWTPESCLIVVRKGGYYGYGGPRVTADRPTGWDLPMCFIPRELDNSGGGQVWVEGDRWGPFQGKMLHLSYGQCRFLLALEEVVDGQHQGGTITFPTQPSDFESGIMRGRFSAHDGQLYVSGLRGWQTRAIRDGCFQRVRYTGRPIHLPVRVRTYRNGIQITFTEELDREEAQNPDNYFVEEWNYRWTKDYGSPQFSVTDPKQQGRDEVNVRSATLLSDNRTVFLELPERKQVHQITIDWFLRAASGTRFKGKFAHTINTDPSDSFDESTLVRRPRRRLITAEVEARLAPGLAHTFRSGGDPDIRTARLAALRHDIREPITPFQDPGPFSLEMNGTVEIPRSGLYDFRLTGTGEAVLFLNGNSIANLTTQPQTPSPLLLRRGHNPLRIDYISPSEGTATVQLQWKGVDFDWEPVPPNLLHHDSETPGLAEATRRRHGRQLFADNGCARCHRIASGERAMFELSLDAPDLARAGTRFTKDWLIKWMTDPKSLRRGTHMPAVLGNGREAEQKAADISAFLMSIAPDGSPDSPAAGNDNGEELYESLGCISCHHFDAPGSDEAGRLSLKHTRARFRTGKLATYLANPDRFHPSTRMPDFALSSTEASALATFIRDQSVGRLKSEVLTGNADSGERLFRVSGCANCHSVGVRRPRQNPTRKLAATNGGCLAEQNARSPHYSFSASDRSALTDFMAHDLDSLARTSAIEASARLVERLQCANCHDRDASKSHRGLILAEEGSGRTPETIPSLTWAGEKLRSEWTSGLLAGAHGYRSRPWLNARMPGFSRYADALSVGFAAEHAVPATEAKTTSETSLVETGMKLTLQNGLDCRQCHAVGEIEPRGDEKTTIALGINFAHIRERLRRDSYHRFMIDPPRYDITTKMIKLSENGKTTKLKAYFDADAKQQFEAVWQYIQSLPPYNPE